MSFTSLVVNQPYDIEKRVLNRFRYSFCKCGACVYDEQSRSTSYSVTSSTENKVEGKSDDTFREVIAKPLSSHETNHLQTLPQVFVAIVVVSFHIIYGIGLTFSAILIPQIEAPDSDLKMTQAETSWVTSIIVLCIPVGYIFAGYTMESIGRLNTIKLSAIPCCLGWVLIAIATNIYMMFVGRILTGLGIAIGTIPSYLYVTEIARPDLRGALLSTTTTLASVGMLITYAEGAFMSWRLVAWLNLIYTLVPVVLIQLYVPESPIWLVSKGRIESAAKSLKYFYKVHPSQSEHDHAVQDMATIHLDSLQREHAMNLLSKMNGSTQTKSASIQERFHNIKLAGFLKPTGYRPMIVLFWLFLIQQFSGIYITLFYAVTFVQDMGTEINAFTASIYVGVARFLMSLMSAWLMKRFRRRSLIMVSSAGMAACMLASGLVTYWIEQGQTGIEWVAVACLLLYICSSMIGMLSIPWTMTAELFPNDIRSMGHSLSSSMGDILMFTAIQSYRSISNYLGSSYAVQWFFAFVSICGFVFGLVFLPETHRKELNEIQAYFAGGKASKQKKIKEKFCEDTFKYRSEC